MKDQFIGMSVIQKVKTKIWQINIDIFFESNFLGVNRLFVLQMKMGMLQDLMLKNIIYQKELLIIMTSLSVEKTVMISQLILI